MENTISAENGSIYISCPDWEATAWTEFTEEIWETINQSTWTRKSNKKRTNWYLYSNKLKKYFHQIVVEHWYGESTCVEFKKRGFVVDHLDNNGFNCRLSNLAFAPNRINVAKGLTFDIESNDLLVKLVLRIFRDFEQKKFRMTIATNAPISLVEDEGTREDFAKIELIYPDDYETILYDGLSILTQYRRTEQVHIDKLRFLHKRVEDVLVIQETPEEVGANPTIIWRNGVTYLIRGKVRIVSANYDKNWNGEKTGDE